MIGNGAGIIDETALNIFADGSCLQHEGMAGGAGVVLIWVDASGDAVTHSYAPPGWEKATNNEMEIMACIIGLEEVERIPRHMDSFSRIVIFSDSRYVVDNFFSAIRIWPQRGWRLNGGGVAANVQLWKRLRKLVLEIGLKVDVAWVKGHKQSVHNKSADRLARLSAAIPIQRPLSTRETSKKWSPRKTRRGSVVLDGRELKIRVIGWQYLRSPGQTYEYRYEVIDKKDPNFQDVDFIRCQDLLHRNHCYRISTNSNGANPFIVGVLEELEPDDYRK